MENAEGTVKIRMKGLDKGEPITFRYPFLKVPVTFNEKGVAEISLVAAKRLLGPDFEGIYERFEELQEISSQEPIQVKRHRKTDSVEVKKEEVKDFLTKMEEPLAADGSNKL